MGAYLQYGNKEIAYLSKKDKRLAAVINRVGMIHRPVIPDPFRALVFSIIGQQVSSKAHLAIWQRMGHAVGDITPDIISGMSLEDLRRFGMSYRKAGYIQEIACKFKSGQIDSKQLYNMTDCEVCDCLCALNGVGQWTAEMVMLFSLQRPDILSFNDFGIIKGLKMIYHHKYIDRARFERYRQRFSPYCSVASLYIWAAAAGA